MYYKFLNKCYKLIDIKSTKDNRQFARLKLMKFKKEFYIDFNGLKTFAYEPFFIVEYIPFKKLQKIDKKEYNDFNQLTLNNFKKVIDN